MRFGFVGPSYTAQSGAIADSELINFFAESNEDQPVIAQQEYGGASSGAIKSLIYTPGLAIYGTLPAGPVRGQLWTGSRLFVVADTQLYEVFSDKTFKAIGFIASDGKAVSMAYNSLQVLVVGGGHAYCFTLSSTPWAAKTAYQVGSQIVDAAGHVQQATAAAWQASTAYAVGAQIVDSGGNIQQAAQAMWAEETVYAVGAEIVDANGHVQKASAAAWQASTAYAAGAEIVDDQGNIQTAAQSMWAAGIPYALGFQIVDSNGNVQKVTTAGTSGANQPAWAAAGTTNDGSTLVWTYQGPSNGNAGTSGTTTPRWGTGVTTDNSPLYWNYAGPSGGNAGKSGDAAPAFSVNGGTVADATALLWTDQGAAADAGTSGDSAPTWASSGNTPDNGTLIWAYQGASNGSAGTSGAALPQFNDAGKTTPDGTGTLVWQDKGSTLLEVTSQLAGVPQQCDCSDTYFIVSFVGSNKFQMSQLLDGTTWPGQLVNEVSVFAENIVSVIVNQRELWIFGQRRIQPYQDTGNIEVFDPVSGALVETGSGATFGVTRADSSVFWAGLDDRGAWVCWRNEGYSPQRVSTHAVEVWLSQQARASELTGYAYQDRGHLFWVLYVPDGDCTWVYDVSEQLWHKRATWVNGAWMPHRGWNHSYAFGKHLVGDWANGNLYEMSFSYYDDAGTPIRRLRRTPTVTQEKAWLLHQQITVDFEAGDGPQPPLLDGTGNEREPQAMLRWSDDRGRTWSNEHTRGCGFAGQYGKRVFWMRLGRSRNRVYELAVTDPIPWTIVDAYLEASSGE